MQDEGWISTRKAAAHLDMSTNALYKLTSARSLPFQQDRPGARCWFRRSDLDAWRRGEDWKRPPHLRAA